MSSTVSAPARRMPRTASGFLLLLASGTVLLWIAIHHYPALGPALADGARALVGPAPVPWLEDRAYGAQDAYQRWRYGDAQPTAYWAPPPADSAVPARPESAFPPAPVDPPHAKVALEGDGSWTTIADPHGEDPVLVKTQLHPDPARPFAVVAVIAMDLARVRLHAVPGYLEPVSSALPREVRRAKVAKADWASLVAGFNGGFQVMHGRWGMQVEGLTLVAPRPEGCTVARYRDGSTRIDTWDRLARTEAGMAFFRQAPPCLVESGSAHPESRDPFNTSWGVSVDGGTIIRRSGLGLDRTGQVAFYAMGDSLSAGSLAQALRTAGAWQAMQLDVNWAFPRFVVYDGRTDGPPRVREAIGPIRNWTSDEFVEKASDRDFFYVTRNR